MYQVALNNMFADLLHELDVFAVPAAELPRKVKKSTAIEECAEIRSSISNFITVPMLRSCDPGTDVRIGSMTLNPAHSDSMGPFGNNGEMKVVPQVSITYDFPNSFVVTPF